MITANLKTLDEILTILFGAGYTATENSLVTEQGKEVDQKYYFDLKTIAGTTVNITEIDPIEKTFVLPVDNITKLTLGINLLDPTSIDTSNSDLYFGRCGFTPKGSSPYPYAPRYTWSEVIAGQSQADIDAKDQDQDITFAVLKSEGYYNDGLVMCPYCKKQHLFDNISIIF